MNTTLWRPKIKKMEPLKRTSVIALAVDKYPLTKCSVRLDPATEYLL